MLALPGTLRAAALIFSVLLAASCGGGGGATQPIGTPTPPGPPAPAANVLSISLSPGPNATSVVNTLYTSVVVCVPGSTTECQTIDDIQVDTGSFGLRLISSVLTLSLPGQMAANGNSLVECTVFADGYSWGPVQLADVQMAGEKASSVTVQVIGSASFPTVPADCAGTGTAEDSVAAFGANGVLGVGVFAQDCGAGCVTTVQPTSYYSCTSSVCTATTASLATQVVNPVVLLATDKNGVIIELPSIPAEGAATVAGSLIFGIDTQSNNKSGNQTVLLLNPSNGLFTTVYNSQSLGQSFLDTGSNALYFIDASIPQCTNQNYAGFYCPTSTLSLSASLQGQDVNGDPLGASATVNFSVANTQTLSTDEPTFLAFSSLAGTLPQSGQNSLTNTFDWGLPFYFGRTVYTAIQGATTSVGTGPYIAF
jgi:hypothetical protein